MARSPYAGDSPPRYFSSQPVYFSDVVDHSAEATAYHQQHVYDNGRLEIQTTEYPVHPYSDIESRPANFTHPSRNSYHWNDITSQHPYGGRVRQYGNAQIPHHGCFDAPDGTGNVWSTRPIPVAQSQSYVGGDVSSMLPTDIDAWPVVEAADNPAGRISDPASPFGSFVAPWAQSYDRSYTGLQTNTFNTAPQHSPQPPIQGGLTSLLPAEVLLDDINGGYASSVSSALTSGSSSTSHGASGALHNERDFANPRRRGREQKVILERRKHPATHICPECAADFTTNSARNKHVESKHKFHVFTCERCAKQYADDSSLGRHIRTKHTV